MHPSPPRWAEGFLRSLFWLPAVCYPSPAVRSSGLERMNRTSERQPRVREATLDRIAGWAQTQFDAWRDTPARSLEALRDRLAHLEAASPHIFLFDFTEGAVTLRPKTKSWPELQAAEAELLRRATLYLALFRDVVAGFDLDCRFPLAIDVDDHPMEASGTPLFAFQKLAGSSLILLPDVDILTADYFISPQYDDPFSFEEKADHAIFVGSTTGYNLTRDVVETLAMPRLRSAVFFRDAPDVTFHLPTIVQYDTEETADMVRALGVGGSPASWKEQFGHRYLLSMDGNGATCSRVAIALKSRSLLIKYASNFQLFYFQGLAAGEDFLSVSRDEDVYDAMAWCREHPALASAIAESGRRFARKHLSRLPILIYVASLLEAYGRTALDQAQGRPADILGCRTVIDAYGHIQNIGDMRPILGGWLSSPDGRGAIEGFALEPGPGLDPKDISYQAVLSDGSLSRPCFGHGFCGTRGRNQGLRGFSVTLAGTAAEDYALSYLATFADGTQVGPAPGGRLCRSPSGAALTGLRVRVSARGRD